MFILASLVFSCASSLSFLLRCFHCFVAPFFLCFVYNFLLYILLFIFRCLFTFPAFYYLMTAATKCEQLSSQASANGLVGAFVPQCSADGSFKSKQCWGSTGYCWCVDKYGKEVPGTKIRGEPDCSKKGNNLRGSNSASENAEVIIDKNFFCVRIR